MPLILIDKSTKKKTHNNLVSLSLLLQSFFFCACFPFGHFTLNEFKLWISIYKANSMAECLYFKGAFDYPVFESTSLRF